MRVVKLSVFSTLMVMTAGLLGVVSSRPLFAFSPFDSPVVNWALNYQLSAVLVATLALMLTFAFATRLRLAYLSPQRRGAMRPLLRGAEEGRWESDGWVIGLVMVAITGVATLLQFLPGGFTFHWAHVALAVPFAAMNAFTEEAVFRLPYVTMGDNQCESSAYGLAMGSIVFGVFHYWGVAPNGLVGAIMSAALGFILAKSIQETKGFFWAFTIHFMLNLVGMVLILNQTP
jgi:hypothetical protein